MSTSWYSLPVIDTDIKHSWWEVDDDGQLFMPTIKDGWSINKPLVIITDNNIKSLV